MTLDTETLKTGRKSGTLGPDHLKMEQLSCDVCILNLCEFERQIMKTASERKRSVRDFWSSCFSPVDLPHIPSALPFLTLITTS